MPFGNQSLKTENMKLLTVDQALADLAYFIGWVKETKQYGVNRTNPWLNIGGSYPGAMSAWFRLKYPHLTVGALASSAVVNAIIDFKAFDYQIYNSTLKSGDWCPAAIQELTKTAELYI